MESFNKSNNVLIHNETAERRDRESESEEVMPNNIHILMLNCLRTWISQSSSVWDHFQLIVQ